jgi:capsular exopolysaccharide synthesis family protein
MQDALRKAAEERDRRRRREPVDGGPGLAPDVPAMPPSPGSSHASLPLRSLTAELPARAVTVEPPPARTAEPPPRSASPVSAAPAASAGGRAARALSKLGEMPEPATPQRRSAVVDPRIITFHKPRDPRSEAFRSIRASLLTMDAAPKSILITSGSREEGKSLAASNLAASMVENGNRRVLLIDANLRNPELDVLLAARSGPGLSDLLDGRADDLASLIEPTGIPNVDLLSCGTVLDNPGALLQPMSFSGVLWMLERDYDLIIVDSPALEDVADAAVLAPEVDGVVLVVAVEGPSRSGSERAIELLEAARARILGAIAMNCRH